MADPSSDARAGGWLLASAPESCLNTIACPRRAHDRGRRTRSARGVLDPGWTDTTYQRVGCESVSHVMQTWPVIGGYAGAGLGVGLQPSLGPLAAAYVLFLAILGPYLRASPARDPNLNACSPVARGFTGRKLPANYLPSILFSSPERIKRRRFA